MIVVRQYICRDCGAILEESELHWEEWDEPREFWGMPCTEHFVEVTCPCCGSDYIEEKEEEDEAV